MSGGRALAVAEVLGGIEMDDPLARRLAQHADGIATFLDRADRLLHGPAEHHDAVVGGAEVLARAVEYLALALLGGAVLLA